MRGNGLHDYMIAVADEQLLTLADRALRKGDLAQCRSFLLSVGVAKRPVALLADVTYRLAKQRAAEGKYGEAKELFAETIQRHPSGVVQSLAQERNYLINRIAKGEERCVIHHKGLASDVKVKPALRVDQAMLRPEIQFTGSPAAYRSGWDPQKGDPLSTLIRLMKKGVEETTIQRLGEYLAVYAFFETSVLTRADLILPVPTRPARETARGYSIPKVLADVISTLCGVPLHEELVRTSDTALELREVPRWYRKHAVNGAFQATKKADWLRDQTVLIIDDVITTGATVREVARVVLRHGAREVSAIALAHTEWGG